MLPEQQNRALTDIEREAAYSWREWPIYIVMRLKRLQAIQEKLRVQGKTPSQMIRREELLKAVYDLSEPPTSTASAAQPPASPVQEEQQKEQTIDSAPPPPQAASSDSDYYEDISYDEE